MANDAMTNQCPSANDQAFLAITAVRITREARSEHTGPRWALVIASLVIERFPVTFSAFLRSRQ